ncbi:hypothetical protein CcCBS67573_g05065 [Chytriomyces confervae]|uniref:SH3 domain-containing protein n=1 Tax=Chytriomyces confervae TaxID=246404 RepID=A0A507FBU7_9FUNG|nr:hypothetical protein HDU80_010257 [Chytriomyces hyalinus]TPX73674.1 hypothetical protein CcCBS67573_g05065 [Chytriomyces confervae]
MPSLSARNIDGVQRVDLPDTDPAQPSSSMLSSAIPLLANITATADTPESPLQLPQRQAHSSAVSLFLSILLTVVLVGLIAAILWIHVFKQPIPRIIRVRQLYKSLGSSSSADSDEFGLVIQKVKRSHTAVMGDELTVVVGESVEVLEEDEGMDEGWCLVRRVRNGETGSIPMHCLTGEATSFTLQ